MINRRKIRVSYTEEKPLVGFKFTGARGEAPWGRGTWSLPIGTRPGAVMSIVSEYPRACAQGIHCFPDAVSLLCGHLTSSRLFVCEVWGRVDVGHNKVAAQSGRLCYELKHWPKIKADMSFMFNLTRKCERAFWLSNQGDVRMRMLREAGEDFCAALQTGDLIVRP